MNDPTQDPQPPIDCGDTTPRDWRNWKRVLWALLAWAISFLGATYAIRHDLLPAGPVAWMVAAVPAGAGLVVLFMYRRLLREADELLRLIQLQALALAFGATWIALFTYPLIERLGAPPVDAGDYVLVMAVFYTLGGLLGRRRYR